MDKAQLRKQVMKLIGSLAAASKQAQSEQVFKRLIQHPRYQDAARVSIYLSTDQEIDTIPLLKHALEVGAKQCYIPFVRQKCNAADGQPAADKIPNFKTRMVMVELASMDDYEALPLNRYRIREPTSELIGQYKIADPEQQEASLDLVIVPGVAFARDGRRLGHGKGYYDEFLSDWVKRAPTRAAPYTIGLGFNEQLVEDPFAVEGQDYVLDEVLTATQE